MKIIAVEKEKKGKINVQVEGKSPLVLKTDDFYSSALYDKENLTEDEYESLEKKVMLSDAREAAIKYVVFRMRSCGEVRNKLIGKGISEEVADEVISSLCERGYLDDGLYLKKFILQRTSSKACSRKALQYELMKKGFDRDIAWEAALKWAKEDRETAYDIITRKYGGYPPDDKGMAKVFAALTRVGYEHDSIKAALEKIAEEAQDK